MNASNEFIMASATRIAFDEASDAADAAEIAAAKEAADAATEASRIAAEKLASGKVEFSAEQQAVIDASIKTETDKAKRAMQELEALKARTDLTTEARKDVEGRLDTMQQELMTKEELFEKEKKKNKKIYNETVDTLTSERDTWKTKFTNSTIIRAITDASIKNEAFDSDTISAILGPKTELIEALDDDGNPKGEYESKVKFTDPEGKDGKPAELLLTVSEAVKRMSELDKYAYLFKGKGAGGVNLSNSAGGKGASIERLAKDPASYRKARKEGKILT